jgi:hypothetical protein
MKFTRIFTPLFFTFALLFAQQAATAHALSHACEHDRQQGQHLPHSPACDKCEQHAQLGSALQACAFELPGITASSASAIACNDAFRSAQILTAAARGPPASL